MATASYRERIKAIRLLLPELQAWVLSRGELSQAWLSELIQYEQRRKSGKLSQRPSRRRSKRKNR